MAIVNCTTCNNELIRNNSQIKASKTGNFFCGRECRSKWDSIKFENQKTELECPYCLEKFYDVPSASKNRVFCSQQCLADSRSDAGNIIVECEYCNIEFKKLKSQIRENNLCSVACRSSWNAENHNRVELTCNNCYEKYEVTRHREDSSKTCSRKCYFEYHFKSGNGKTSGTKPERMVESYLKENNIEYISQHFMYDKFIVDFYLPKYNMVLEVNGDFWHCNPKIYGDGLIEPRELQIRQSNKDKSRKAYLEKCGHNFRVAWEMDIYEDVNSLLKSIIN